MYYGVSYYPEHKSPEELAADLKLLKESGINTVRMGEFAWNRFEPEEGRYEFGWLDGVVAELGEAGIKTIVCTPTACPPDWIFYRYPDMAYTDNRRVKRPFGGRRHYCYSNEDYRRHCAAVTKAIARHYGTNPYVAGFQIDNEPAQETTGRCCCPSCTIKFQNWLKSKYGSIEEWNRRSGGIFWSQEYSGFFQIHPPVNTIEVHSQQSINAYHENPTLRLEFERFSSESQIEFQDIQTDILKQYTAYPVTTNSTGLATNSIDYYRSFQKLDCFAFDFYPNLRDSKVDSFPYAFARGIKHKVPFWVLEFVSGGGHKLGGDGRLQPNPGALKQAVVQSMAHGAEMMLHFQFRTFPFGAEQLNYAIVDADGVPRRRYREMQETAKLLKQLEPLEKTVISSQAAICFDYDCHWALRIKPVNDPLFHYIRHASLYYNTLAQLGVGTDVISFDADFSGYKAIVLPAAIVLPERMREKLKGYVKKGGTLIATFLTSAKNEDNVGYTESLPAGLTDLFGMGVQEVEPVFPLNQAEIRLSSGETGKDGGWSELLEGSAEMKAIYAASFKRGQGVVSYNRYGSGHAWYIGTCPENDLLKRLLEAICANGAIEPNTILPPAGSAVEVVKRCCPESGKAYYFLFNFGTEPVSLQFGKGYIQYLDGSRVREITMQQNGITVLESVEA